MAFNIADRVFETTSTQGTGTINLAGAQTGFQSFVTGIGTGNQCYYIIDDGTDWEVGIGTVTSGSPDTLSRDTILESSNSDAAVNWGSGTRNVRVTVPAEGWPTLKTDNTFEGVNTFSGNVTASANLSATAKVFFPDKSELTIATGEITVTGVSHTVDTESDAASDDLDTINGGADGQILILRPDNTARDIVLKHGTGNILTIDGNDLTLDNTEKSVLMQYDAALASWVIIASPTSITVLDEDDMASDSATAVPTQQSVKAYVDNTAIITKEFVSAVTTYTNGGFITLPHGLGERPKFVQCVAVCTTANLGYSVNDEVVPNNGSSTTGSLSSSGFSYYWDATNVYIQIGLNGLSLHQKSASAGAYAAASAANWKIRARAWA